MEKPRFCIRNDLFGDPAGYYPSASAPASPQAPRTMASSIPRSPVFSAIPNADKYSQVTFHHHLLPCRGDPGAAGRRLPERPVAGPLVQVRER